MIFELHEKNGFSVYILWSHLTVHCSWYVDARFIDMFLSTLHVTKFTWLTLSLAFMCSWWRIFGLFIFSSFNFYNFFFLFKMWLFDVYYLNCTEIVILRKFVYLLLFLFSCFSVYLLFPVCGFYAIIGLLFCFGLGFFIFYWILM